MGCGASLEASSNGLPRCSAIVKRRLLVLRYCQNRNSRGQHATGYHYELDHEIDFDSDNLGGYRILRPLECNLELAAAVSEHLKRHKHKDWTFICQVRNGTRRLLPSVEVDQPQPEIVLIQKTLFCRCKSPEYHDITRAAEDDRVINEPVRSEGNQERGMEIREGPPQYQKSI